MDEPVPSISHADVEHVVRREFGAASIKSRDGRFRSIVLHDNKGAPMAGRVEEQLKGMIVERWQVTSLQLPVLAELQLPPHSD